MLMACTAAPGNQAGSSASAAAVNRDATLTVAVVADPGARGFNPRTNANVDGRRVDAEIFAGLIEKNYYEPSKPMGIVPGLATRWDVSADGTTYTFHLRKGVDFTDGTPFNADAVVFNLNTLLDPNFEFYDKPGAASANAYVTSVIKTYRAVNPETVEIVLKQPTGWFLDEWSLPSQPWIISPAAYKTYGVAGISTHPVSAGPFKLESYKPGEAVVLTRNDSYFRGPAAYKTLVLKVIPDQAARAVALQSGEVQIAINLPIQYLDQWKGRQDVAIQVTNNPAPYACWKNQLTGPMVNRDFREAVSLAINRPQINQLAMAGLSVVPNGWMGPATPAYTPNDPAPLAYDAKAAAAAIERLGMKGTKLTIDTTPSLGDPVVWETMATNLRDAGLTPVMRNLEINTWNTDRTTGPGGALVPTVDMVCGQVGTDSMWYLYIGTTPNYDNPKVKAGFTQAFASKNQDEYLANIKNVNKLFSADYEMIFVMNNINVDGVSSKVTWKKQPAHYHSFYSTLFK
jgi:peptide/nickel transport system substrate-binding protein